MAEEVDYPTLLAQEYGQYVATQDIYYDGALAYVAGHAVPATNVEAHGYLDSGQVKKVASKTQAAKAAAVAADSTTTAKG